MSPPTAALGRPIWWSWFSRVAVAWFLVSLAAPIVIWLAAPTSESRSVNGDDPESAVTGPDMAAPSEPGVPSSLEPAASIRRFVGQIHPGSSVAAIAPMNGSITSLEAPDFGVFVEEGDLLITLDPSDEAGKALREARIAVIEARSELLKLENWSTSSEMREAERSVKDAEREVKRAKLEHDRTKQLFDDGIVSENEYETTSESLRSTESQWQSSLARHEELAEQGTGERLEITKERFIIANTDYEALEASQQHREIRAPISGIMLPAPATEFRSSNLSVGQAVEKGTSLFLVGTLDEIIVQTSVSEFDIDLIAIGQKATITSPARPDFEATGEVTSMSQISSSFGDAQGLSGGYTPPPSRYDVAVKVSTGDQEIKDKIRLGMTVDVKIDTAAADVVAGQ